MLILAKNQSDVDKLKDHLSDKFWMKNLGKPKKILCIDIKRDIKTKALVGSNQVHEASACKIQHNKCKANECSIGSLF
jgi:hypothetical protein